MKLLSEEILKIRKEHKLTQQELADKIYVTRQAVSKWECNKAFPSQEVINKIKEEFSVDLNELLTEEEIKSSIVSNNVAIRKLNTMNKFLIVGFSIIAIVVIVFSIILIVNNLKKQTVNMEIDVDIKYNYVTWTELVDADYYIILIDGKPVGRTETSGFQWSNNKVSGKMEHGILL